VGYQKSTWLRAIQLLAKQLKDAPLFEKSRLATGTPSVAARTEIAKVYLEWGDAKIALSRLQHISGNETFMLDEGRQLFLEIYHQFK